MTTEHLDLDSVARRYVEHDTLPMTTFGPLGEFGEAAVAGDNKTTWPDGGYWEKTDVFTGTAFVQNQAANDNRAAMGAGMSDVDPEGLFLAATRETQGGGYVYPRSRHGDFMQTYSARKFWPLDARHEEIHIEDIAHALAMQCRYGGHCERFYSVAEHSVLMARSVSHENAMWALLHDAAEAYLADVPRPLKRYLPGYKEAEAKVMAAICERFGLPSAMPAEVHDADNRILADEIVQNMRPMAWHGEHTNPLGVKLEYWSPEEAEDQFLAMFVWLQNMSVAA